MERLIEEVGLAVSERLQGGDDVDAVARALHEQLMLRGESTKHLVVESIYVSLVVFFTSPSWRCSIH